MKTTIISIPSCSASQVLRALHENNITCKYLGLEQSERILMELKSKKNIEPLIRELILKMEENEKFVNEVVQVIKEGLKKKKDESDKAFNEAKKEYHSKDKNEASTVTT